MTGEKRQIKLYNAAEQRFQRLGTLHENRLPPRAYFIPAQSEAAAADSRFICGGTSDRALLLSGEWLFKYYPSCKYLDPASEDGFSACRVPSCWQTDGYEPPFYVNVRYPFPAEPPFAPADTPVGVYKRKFNLERGNKTARLNFLGVSSAFDVYINGRFAGYSEGSRLTSEFDISEYLRGGENEITVVVYKWCSGSYLEAQDMFRYNGIFRDVYILLLPDNRLDDIYISTEKVSGKKWRLAVKTEVSGKAALGLILKHNGKVAAVRENCSRDENFEIENPRLWSAETPELYELFAVLTGADGEVYEVSCHDVGFKEVHIKGKVMHFNGCPIKIKGVNRHDIHPDRGSALSLSDFEQDIRLMKTYNVNAVRTSHYVPDPRFLLMCSRSGLYVMEESDLECHGAFHMREQYDRFSADPEWEEAFLDRTQRMYLRDRNNPCVFMWSLGNESGGIRNHDLCAEFIKSADPSALIHYEGAVFKERLGYDVVSMMYPTFEQCKQHAESDNPMPFIMCEYAHSMGVGPGGLEEYWRLIDKYDSFIGGFIWEFADQAARDDGGNFTYGGDHGEYIHDGNFCCDGLFYPDRLPSSSAYEMKAIYRPVKGRLTNSRPAAVTLKNTNYFLAYENLTVAWQILKDGIPSDEGEIKALSLAPQEEKSVSVKYAAADGELYLDLTVTDCAGKILAEEQHYLSGSYVFPEARQDAVTWEFDENKIFIRGSGSEIVFDIRQAGITGIRAGGKEILNQKPLNTGYNFYNPHTRGFLPCIWRAPTDNDMYMKSEWTDAGYDMMWFSPKDVSAAETRDALEVTVSGSYSPPAKSKEFDCVIGYKFLRLGGFTVTAELSPCFSGLPHLPRWGLDIELDKSFEDVIYYGKGERENYPDFQAAAKVGRFSLKAREFTEPYIRPQETGHRCEVRYAELRDSCGRGLRFRMDGEPLGFSVSENSVLTVEKTKHRQELSPEDTVRVSLNGFMCGLGSQSCGHQPEDKYKVFPDKTLKFSFKCDVLDGESV